jgi:predicted nucleic acid-binding protein
VKDVNSHCALDANVILRHIMEDDPELAQRAHRLVQAIDDGRVIGHLDPVVLSEVVYVLKSFYRMPLERITEILLPLVQHANILVSDKARYIDALTLFASGVPHFGDACACAMALRQCGGRLLSFDRKLGRVPGVKRSETV